MLADDTRPNLGSAPGPLADRLVTAFADEDGENFDGLAHELLAAGMTGVLDLAVRKTGDRLGDDMADEILGALLEVAEGADVGPSAWAELVALPVALPTGEAIDAALLAESFLQSGALHPAVDIRFLPGWRSPEALARLDPAAVRRVLIDVIADREPFDVPPSDTDDLAEAGFGLLLGVQVDWSIQTWEEVAADGLPEQSADEDETPEEAQRAAAFDRWSGNAFATFGGCVAMDLVAPSEVQAEIADFLENAGRQIDAIQRIRDLVALAQEEAKGEEVVCRPEVVGEGLELTFYTRGGRFLDSLSLAADQLPTRAEEMPRLIEPFVRLLV